MIGLILKIFFFLFAIMMLMLLPFPSFSFTPSDVKESLEKSKEYQQYINQSNEHSDEMEGEARKTYGTFKTKVMPEVDTWKGRIKYDGESIVIHKEPQEDKNKYEFTARAYLAEDERIYIFVSSSIPKTTLINYAMSMDKLGDPRIMMVLRGCIGGCEKLMPTAAFVQDIIAPSKEEELLAEFIIDPMLFRYYNITAVPTIVFAKGVNTEMDEGSEGLEENMKGTPNAYAVLGDVSLDYAIDKINKNLSKPNLTLLVKDLRKSWFDGDRK